MTLAEEKAAARTSALAVRAAAHAAADPVPAQDALHSLIRRMLPAGTVSGYVAMRGEIDPMPVLGRLAAEGYDLCLPVVPGRAVPLQFRRWRPGAALVPGGFGTRIPQDTETLRPDLLIVPLLAFDARLYRLGYGGGYYDRTLAALREGGPARAIGLAYAGQQVDRLPVEATDIALDAVVTERGVLYPDGPR